MGNEREREVGRVGKEREREVVKGRREDGEGEGEGGSQGEEGGCGRRGREWRNTVGRIVEEGERRMEG